MDEILKYYKEIEKNGFSYVEYNISGHLNKKYEFKLDLDEYSEFMTDKQYDEMKKKYYSCTIEGNVNGLLDKIVSNYCALQNHEKKILCRLLSQAECNAVSLKVPENDGYLILIDAGILLLLYDFSRVLSIFLSKRNVNNIESIFYFWSRLKDIKKSIKFYKKTNSYYSFYSKDVREDFMDFPLAGLVVHYMLSFIIYHEIEHIVNGDCDNDMFTRSNDNEIRSDINAFSKLYEKSTRILTYETNEDLYRNIAFVPFYLLGIFTLLEEEIAGKDQSLFSHPLIKERISKLEEYCNGSTIFFDEEKSRINLFYTYLGVNLFI